MVMVQTVQRFCDPQ